MSEEFRVTDYIYGCGCPSCKAGVTACVGSWMRPLRCDCGGMCAHYGRGQDKKEHVHISKKLVVWLRRNTLSSCPRPEEIKKFKTWAGIYKLVFTESMRNPGSVPTHIAGIIDRLFSRIKKDDIMTLYAANDTSFIRNEVRTLLQTDAKWCGVSLTGKSIAELMEILKPLISPYLEYPYIVHIIAAQKPQYWELMDNPDVLAWLHRCVQEAREEMDFLPPELMITTGEMFRLQDMLKGFRQHKESDGNG